jgi:hypothetical protein
MVRKQNITGLNLFGLAAILAALTFLITACGGGKSDPDESASDAGKLHFSLVYHGPDAGHLRTQAAVIDCASEGIATVEATIFDSNHDLLVNGDPWDCDTGQGTITAVPAGSERIVVILGKDSGGNVVFRGEKAGIRVVADKNNNAGIIDCHAFIPHLQVPADGAVVDDQAMGLAWYSAAGAFQYQMKVSQTSDMSDVVIDYLSSTVNYTPGGLSQGQTYYWQVIAVDAYGNKGVGSQIRSFVIDQKHANSPPSAQITRPIDRSVFSMGDSIVFTGHGTDPQDGDLDGQSLVWESDLDGEIGRGATVSKSDLGEGTHRITLTATDADGATESHSITITIGAAPVHYRLPDTGQDESYTGSDIFGEDSDYSINPPSYTKLDASGNALDSGASTWAMVRDNVTGLIWEAKTDDDDSIHSMNKTYTAHTVQSEFIDQLNSTNFGGHSDWRLPDTRELLSIVDKGSAIPAVNLDFFPNTVVSSIYLTSTSNGTNHDQLWPVYFRYGDISTVDKINPNHVRAVRGETQSVRLVDNDGDETTTDGIVTDTVTGLMWQQGESSQMSWEEALAYCEGLELGGYDDWRLPNYNELQTLVDYEKAEHPSIDTDFFPNANAFSYWSSTTYVNNPYWAFSVQFNGGSAHGGEKSTSNWVRAVRGGE